MRKIIKIINALNRSMFFFSALAIISLSLIVFYDVIARYLFNEPTSFGFDLSTWLTGLVAYLAGGYVLLNKGHIRVDILYDMFPERIKRLVDLFTGIFIMLISGVLIWYGGGHVFELYQNGAIASSGWNVPLWIKWLILPTGGILLGLQGVQYLFETIYSLFGKNYEEVKN